VKSLQASSEQAKSKNAELERELAEVKR